MLPREEYLGADWNYFQDDKDDILDTRYLLKTVKGEFVPATRI
ncbi:MAG TPA: hypothetical protein PKA19_05340 [Bacillota bacterium]|nr:hypothetical protein [Bacillota bacterium]